METIFDIVEDANVRIENLLDTMKRVAGEKECGLDIRAGSVWVNEECVIAKTDYRKRLDYYGGFEYVKCEPIVIGAYTIYMADEDSSGRVQEVIDRVFDREVDEEE